MSRLTSVSSIAAIIVFAIAGETFAKNRPWSDRIDLNGDFRYRNESFNIEGKKDRLRHRLQARFELKAKAHEDVSVGVGLATGGDNPTTTNQTLDGGFSTKDIRLDLAYFTWNPSSARGVTVTGGKMKFPFYTPGKTELVWDGDLRPEGLAVKLQTRSSSVTASITVAGFWIDESKSSRDATLSAAQAHIKIGGRNTNAYVRAGGAYFDYSRLEGYMTVYDSTRSFGNSTNVDKTYMYDYNLLEAFVEIGTKFGSTPVTIFGDYVSNSGADSNNVGWLIGARVGKTKGAGSWEARYNYRRIEMDAVLGVFTDSDFIGGGTDGQGHEFGLGVALAERIKVSGTVFINEVGLVSKTDYKRGQLDIAFKF